MSDSEDHRKESYYDIRYGSDKDDSDKYEDREDIPPKRARFNGQWGSNSYECNNDENTSTRGDDEETEAVMSYGQRIMGKFGHKQGKGLGKHGQGIVEPVVASEQRGKRGLGFIPKEEYSLKPEEEVTSVVEEISWLKNPNEHTLTREVLYEWMRIGPEKLSIDDEHSFCDPKILKDVLESKSKLDGLSRECLIKSRYRANPFETIGKGIFLNRAAMKMANMDRVFGNMFTEPKDKDGKQVIGPYDLLYFADVCAGPGGFSEYVFYRKKWRAKGFGFTLKRENDFKLDEFFAGPCETFEPHYGAPVDRDEGDGDIFKPENIESFSSFVMKNTDGEGVHFMMADGGSESVEKSIQEIESKQLYTCQCLVALKIVRTNGNFVVKLFDIFTPFSVGLVYLMYRSFDRVSILKPNSSRPANSERYLICQYKRPYVADIADYLFDVNKLLCKRHDTKRDVLELVPVRVLQEDSAFFNYVHYSNCRLGERQALHLKKIVYFADYPELSDSRQDSLKEQCLQHWNIPSDARREPKRGDPRSKIMELFGETDAGFLSKQPAIVTGYNSLKDSINPQQDWYWVVVGSGKYDKSLSLYLGLGRNNVYRLEEKGWIKLDVNNFHLPAGTLVYGEIVQENVNTSNKVSGQFRASAFHIIDGLFLGKEDIRNLHITKRLKICEIFAKSLSNSHVQCRTKKLYESHKLSTVLPSSLSQRKIKSKKDGFGFDLEHNKFFVPNGLLFFCGTNGNWRSYISTSYNKKYFNNSADGTSVWAEELFASENPNRVPHYTSVCANFKTCFEKRLIWWLDEHDLIWLSDEANYPQNEM